MDACRSIFIVLFCLIAIGCRSTDPSIELLESELRWYEDQLLLMERELSRKSVQLESCQRYSSALQRELSQGKPADATEFPSPTHPSEQQSEFDLDLPEIDYGSERNQFVDPTNSTDSESDSSAADPQAPKVESESPNSNHDDEDVDLEDITNRHAKKSRVARIELNKRLTGGYNSDRKPGDDGLVVVIEPQGVNGDYVPIPGDVTIEAFDRQWGSTARIARWDFDVSETAERMQKSLFGRGIHLELPWPTATPSTQQIRIVARYVADDGRRMKATRDVRIRPSAGRIAQRVQPWHSPTKNRQRTRKKNMPTSGEWSPHR